MDRDAQTTKFRGEETVKLPREKSIMYLLKEEPSVSPVFRGFQRMSFHLDDLIFGVLLGLPPFSGDPDRFRGIEDIRESDEGLKTKLHLASLKAQEVFDTIRSTFVDVFPFVTDIRVNAEIGDRNNLPFEGMIFVQIKEIGVDGWINEWMISSGMRKTLWHIAELHLCARGTVILIDEFENSLGINCIEEVTRQLVNPGRDLQFIITSHHPYIINNIPTEDWKLVTRRGGVVKALDAGDLKLSKSKHDAFTQLINLDPYAEGPEA